MSSLKRNFVADRAFSLVEVVIALGVTSFVLLALLGTLPTGIKSVQDSMSDSAQANILQQIRAELQQVSFGTSSTATNNIVTTLSKQINYYSPEGLMLANSTGAYYMAAFVATNSVIPSTNTSQGYFQYESAQTIQVTLIYPQFAPAASQTTNILYLFAAKQKSY